MVDLNADIGEIVKSLLKKKKAAAPGEPSPAGSENGQGIAPYKNLIIAAVIFILILAAVVFFFIKPYYQERAKKERTLEKKIEMQTDMNNLENQEVVLERKLVKSQEKYQEILRLFENTANVKELYRSISNVAKDNDLLVLNIKEVEKKAEKPVKKKKKKKKNKKDKEVKDKNALPDHVTQIDVSVDLTGGFASYMAFKKDLAKIRPLLSIRNEKISMDRAKGSVGGIRISLKLSTYAIDKTSYQKALKGFQKNLEQGSEGAGEK